MQSHNTIPVPFGYCHCGCGQKTPIATETHSHWGRVKGQPIKCVPGHKAKANRTYTVDPDTGCWNWPMLRQDGYSDRITRNGQRYCAYVWFYIEAKGPVPAGMVIDHTCHNRACVNPHHLEAVSQQVNVQRGGIAKVTPEQVREIRALKGKVPSYKVGPRYGISPISVYLIWQRKTWGNIPD